MRDPGVFFDCRITARKTASARSQLRRVCRSSAVRGWSRTCRRSRRCPRPRPWPQAGTKVQPEILADFVFEYVSDTKTPQGILCLVRQKQYSITEIVTEKGGELPLLLVLDQIQDPGNLGTIVRTAEGAGVTGIVMSQDCVDMYNPKVVRSTMGAAYRVPFCYVDDLAEEVKQMKEAGICTYAAHLEGKNSYDEEDYRKASAFLIGNEGNGLRDEVADQAQVYIRIPMKGQVESLNAAVATAILTFEAARQRR